MPVFDTTRIDYIIVTKGKKELSIVRKDVMDGVDLNQKVKDFDAKNAKKLAGGVLECFCTGKTQLVEGYTIEVDKL